MVAEMAHAYLSVADTGTAEIVIKKSRFISTAMPLHSVDEARQILDLAGMEHKTASHICYAYKTGLAGETLRFDDAGEPAGTAGRPILDVIEKENLRNTMVVVVRYFGGILLGAAGLRRAYAKAAAKSVQAAGIASYALHEIFTVTVGYAVYDRVVSFLAGLGIAVENAAYGEEVGFEIAVPVPAALHVTNHLVDILGGRVRIEAQGRSYRQVKG
jgi:uncharacterized YigZ family protein